MAASWDPHRLAEHSIDTVPYPNRHGLRFHVYIGRPVANGLRYDHVDQPDHGGLIHQLAQAVYPDLLFRLIELDRFVGELLQVAHDLVNVLCGPIVLIQGAVYLVLRRNRRFDVETSRNLHIIYGEHVQRIAHSQPQLVACDLHRQDLVPPGHGLRHQSYHVASDHILAQADAGYAELTLDDRGNRGIGSVAKLHECPPESLACAPLHYDGVSELLGSYGPRVD